MLRFFRPSRRSRPDTRKSDSDELDDEQWTLVGGPRSNEVNTAIIGSLPDSSKSKMQSTLPFRSTLGVEGGHVSSSRQPVTRGPDGDRPKKRKLEPPHYRYSVKTTSDYTARSSSATRCNDTSEEWRALFNPEYRTSPYTAKTLLTSLLSRDPQIKIDPTSTYLCSEIDRKTLNLTTAASNDLADQTAKWSAFAQIFDAEMDKNDYDDAECQTELWNNDYYRMYEHASFTIDALVEAAEVAHAKGVLNLNEWFQTYQPRLKLYNGSSLYEKTSYTKSRDKFVAEARSELENADSNECPAFGYGQRIVASIWPRDEDST